MLAVTTTQYNTIQHTITQHNYTTVYPQPSHPSPTRFQPTSCCMLCNNPMLVRASQACLLSNTSPRIVVDEDLPATRWCIPNIAIIYVALIALATRAALSISSAASLCQLSAATGILAAQQHRPHGDQFNCSRHVAIIMLVLRHKALEQEALSRMNASL